MRYFVTVTHHSVVGYWEELTGVKTLAGAKRKATKEYGNGYIGHVINLVEVDDNDETRALIDAGGWLNDHPSHIKTISPSSKGWIKSW